MPVRFIELDSEAGAGRTAPCKKYEPTPISLTPISHWEKRIANGSEGQRREAREALAHWQGDRWLASIREPALAQLPPAERAECEQVWKTVGQLLERARQSDRPKDQPKP